MARAAVTKGTGGTEAGARAEAGCRDQDALTGSSNEGRWLHVAAGATVLEPASAVELEEACCMAACGGRSPYAPSAA